MQKIAWLPNGHWLSWQIELFIQAVLESPVGEVSIDYARGYCLIRHAPFLLPDQSFYYDETLNLKLYSESKYLLS